MSRYLIKNNFSGVVYGEYEGETEADALDAFARESGYVNYATVRKLAPSRDSEIAVTLVQEKRRVILNLTQHEATQEQREAGVIDLSPEKQEELKRLLTFEELPAPDDLVERSNAIAELAVEIANDSTDCDSPARAMIGGPSFFMGSLEAALLLHGIKSLYAFSKRESIEETLPDGSVRMLNVIRHVGFVRPSEP
jgi:hypothetical protein